MKILITGANGQLGHDLTRVLGSAHDIYPFDLNLDITDSLAVVGKVRDIKPEIIVNSAAYTDVDGCETNAETAYRVNAVGSQNMALAAKLVSAPLVTISTDFVFDGTKAAPYDEFDRPNPRSVYGRSKFAGEELVKAVLPEHYIIRTSWLYGRDGHNFVKTILRLADERDELKVVNDQIGSPTYCHDLAVRISELMTTGWYGTFHVTNAGSCSWYEFACTILAIAGKDIPVKPVTTVELNRPAFRPANSVLRNYLCRLRGFEPMRDFRETLGDYFS